ncbi:hypothetical protein MMC11_007289 [Xylographa trunciseda]|nr:hypothetical protein [Xylographa trunciseda]
MGRWSHYDEDDYRLPNGMQRVGYDADSQTYTYQDSDGSYWEGAPGARYGGLRQVGAASQLSSANRNPALEPISESASTTKNKETDVPCSPREHHVQQDEDILSKYASLSSPKQKDWRLFAPFLFLVCLSLLLVYHLLRAFPAPDTHPEPVRHPDAHAAPPRACVQHEGTYTVRDGDTCAAVAQDYAMSVDELRAMNKEVECEELWVGDELVGGLYLTKISGREEEDGTPENDDFEKSCERSRNREKGRGDSSLDGWYP